MLSAAAAFGSSLQWRTTDLDLSAAIGEESLTATFSFRNAGARPVRIVALDPSCHCMSAEPDKTVYAPGESGEVSVTLTLTGYSGKLRRSLAVTTDEPKDNYARLTMTLDIPEPVAIAPRFQFWKAGDRPDEKRFEIALADTEKVKLEGFEYESADFRVRLETEGPGKQRLLVRPVATGKPADATIYLKAVVAGREKAYRVYVSVK